MGAGLKLLVALQFIIIGVLLSNAARHAYYRAITFGRGLGYGLGCGLIIAAAVALLSGKWRTAFGLLTAGTCCLAIAAVLF